MHVHTGIMFGFVAYLWWIFFHTLAQMIAIQFHSTRFGQALALIA